jgi:BirA family biotin operon repressor/biotin-[acetyl-CoA-carboxylase] ligase
MTPRARHIELPAFYHLVALDQVASTNDEALTLAAEGAGEGTLITARRQTAGRGRRGRTWQSDEGNLFLSLILKPRGGLRSAGAIGFAGALAITDAIAGLMGHDAMAHQKARGPGIALKWPNDVLIRDRKVSGLLIERAGGAAGDALVLGIGINLVSHPDDTRYPATDLSAEGAGEISVSKALQEFSTAFLRRYRGWQEDGFGPLREAWVARARGIGDNLSVEIEGRRFDGVFSTIDETGALCLDQGTAGVKKVTAGDVFFHAAPGKGSC